MLPDIADENSEISVSSLFSKNTIYFFVAKKNRQSNFCFAICIKISPMSIMAIARGTPVYNQSLGLNKISVRFRFPDRPMVFTPDWQCFLLSEKKLEKN
jgi:hypothetical protein